MKENSFKRNRKALTALLLCTGFIAAQPLAVMAEDSVTSVHAVQQPSQVLSRMQQEKPLSVPAYWKKARRTAQSLIWMVNSP